MFNFIIPVVLCLVVAAVLYCKRVFTHWKKRNLPCLKEPTFPYGTMRDMFHKVPFSLKTYSGNMFQSLYESGKSLGYKHGGLYQFTRPMYMPIDPDFIKNILQRDFHQFNERGFYHNEKDDPLSANLFAIGGEKWQFIRKKLSPAFTSGKIRLMIDGLVSCSYQMQTAVDQICKKGEVLDAKEVAECFTIDVIGLCVFGVDCNSFKNPEAEFRKQGRKIFGVSFLRGVKLLVAFTWQSLARWLGVRMFDKDTRDFFVGLVENALKFRQGNKCGRKDFLGLLFELQEESEGLLSKKGLSVEELTAQVFIFFAAGYETSSTTLSFCLYELAENQDVQDKLRSEVNQSFREQEGKITYDAVMDMKYMNQVVSETLRKYPPVSFITRVCVEDYAVPFTNVVVDKGIHCVVSILGVHRDPEYYPNPDRFDPERFAEENRQEQRPFTYMPFGEGPRICIGLRFGLMQVKVALMILLRRYKFSLSAKTVVPLVMDPYRFTMTPLNGIFLNVERVGDQL